MARNCPKAKKKKEENATGENVRGIKGPESRPMKDHPVYLKAWLGKRGVRFLIDTGCERSLTPLKFIGDSRLEPAECRLFAANGTVINIVGEVVMNVKIGELVLPTRFVVSDNINEPMLGVDLLRSNRMIWDVAKDILLINGKVFLDEVSELRNGINVACAILPERLNDLPILVLNSSAQPCEIQADTILTELSLADCGGGNDDEVLTTPDGDRSYLHLSKLLEGVDDDVTEDQHNKLIQIVRKYADVFSKGKLYLGETSLAAHQIDTGDARPMRQILRRQPHHLLDKIDENVQSMLEAGVIEPSCSPCTSNLVVVTKKDGSLRFCVDYRKLNSVTRRDAYPLSHIDECLDALSRSRYFSAFDLRSNYHQVPMDMKHADKTTFIVRTGTYRFRRVPFGLCNAGSTFQRVMDLALNRLNFYMCLVYLDDIIVYSKTVEEHLVQLKKLFDRLRPANLKLKLSKCHLLRAEIKFLGHIVSAEGFSTDPSKIEAVQEWPVPKNVHEVRSFLGLTSYYRRFVPTFAEIASPLHALTMKNKKFDWTTQCEHAFNKLKNSLISSPILAMHNDKYPFLLDTDACDVSIGAVLSQVQEGVERVIAYALRSLSKPERNYCVMRKELLGIVCYTKAFRQYLLGRKFVVRTDHSALQWLRTTPEPIGQQARWCETLNEFDFQIVHWPGRLHGNADALSRKPCGQYGNNGANVTSAIIRAVTFATVEVGDRWSKGAIAAVSEKDIELLTFAGWLKGGLLPIDGDELAHHDPITKNLHAQWERFKIKDGIIYRRYWESHGEEDTWQMVTPVGYREEIMQTAHASVTGGHMGVKKTQVKVARRAYLVGWTRDVRDFCRRCDVCAKYYRGTVKKQVGLHNMCVEAPWERIAIDVPGPHPQSSRSNKFMVTMLGHFTKYSFAFPVRSHDAVTVAKHMVERVFLVCGVSLQLLLNRGAEFERVINDGSMSVTRN